MRIGWKKLFSYLNRKPSNFSSVGIEYDMNGLHLCAFKETDGESCWVLNEKIPLAEWQSTLSHFVKEHELSNSEATIVFSTKKYQMLQTDRPAIPDDELAQALQWSIKDLVMTQEEVVVDYFDIPSQTTGANKVNVVAIPKAELFAVCQGVMESGLVVKRVTVEEVATCELTPDDQDAYVTMIQSPGAEVCLNIVKEGRLYFSRRIRGYEKINSFTEMELQMGVVESLSVELQRSMDFFESQLRQAPVKKILLSLDTEHQDQVVKLVKEAMLVDTEVLVPVIKKAEGLRFEEASYAAIGAALSRDEVLNSENAT